MIFTSLLSNLPPGVTDRMIEEAQMHWDDMDGYSIDYPDDDTTREDYIDDADEDGKNWVDDEPLDDEFDRFDDDRIVRTEEG